VIAACVPLEFFGGMGGLGGHDDGGSFEVDEVVVAGPGGEGFGVVGEFGGGEELELFGRGRCAGLDPGLGLGLGPGLDAGLGGRGPVGKGDAGCGSDRCGAEEGAAGGVGCWHGWSRTQVGGGCQGMEGIGCPIHRAEAAMDGAPSDCGGCGVWRLEVTGLLAARRAPGWFAVELGCENDIDRIDIARSGSGAAQDSSAYGAGWLERQGSQTEAARFAG
jgi:hypothetical protein